MRIFLVFIFFFSFQIGNTQCKVLELIPDTIEFEGVSVYYTQVDSSVQISYVFQGIRKDLGERFSFDCNNIYMPSIPTPIWRNEDFICMASGCGSWCFSHYLLPLNQEHEIQEGGQVLIDTANTIFMSLLIEPENYERYLELKNYNNQQVQLVRFESGLFPLAVPLEYLDYAEPHEHGFHYQDNILTLYLRNGERLSIKVEV